MASRTFKRRLKKVLLWMEVSFILILGAGVGIIGGALYQINKILPDQRAINEFTPTAATRIYSSDGHLLALLAEQNREPVPLNKIPKRLQDATIAIEDSRFYTHHGVDFRGLGRAVWENVRGGNLTQQGGSTLTQQLARDIYLNQKKTISRKLKEAMLAVQIERTWAKKQILETYLNQIYYGSAAYGVQSAAKTYFGKDVRELNLAQCALIAGLPQRPSDYSPYIHPELARRRRDMVLGRMAELGFIKPEQAAKAKQEGVKLVARTKRRGIGYYDAPYFVAHVVEQLRDTYGDDLLYKGGFRVVTTLNWRMQQVAEKAVQTGLDAGTRRNVHDAALVCLDPHTGYIRSMVGGPDFKKDQWNCATQARRQPGSSFKAFVYAAAIDTGHLGPYEVVSTYVPAIRQADGTMWQPHNNDNERYRGSLPVESAFANSVNTAAVNVLLRVGAGVVADYAHRLGIRSKLNAYPSLALGASEVTVLEMASAYGAFATRGVHCDPISVIKIKDRDGSTIYENTPRPKRVNLNPQTFEVMDRLLRAVVEHGTAANTSVRNVPGSHGKTGTTERHTDVWFVGYTPDLVTAVWAGNRNNKPMRRAFGASVCAPIWANFMIEAVKMNPKSGPRLSPETEDARIAKAEAQEVADSTRESRRARARRQRAEEQEPPQNTATEESAPSSQPEANTASAADLSVSANSGNMVRVRVCDESYLIAGPNCPSSRLLPFISGTQPRQMCDVHRGPRARRAAHRAAPKQEPATETNGAND